MTRSSRFNRHMTERERPQAVDRAERSLQAAETGTDDERLAALEEIYQELEGELEQ
jgi:hypothetical protein